MTAERRGCQVDGCERPHHGNGYCRAHGRQMSRRGYTTPLDLGDRPTTCKVDGCGRPHHCHGLCSGHRMQQRRGQEDLTPIGPTGRHRDKCAFDGCDRDVDSKGWCKAHYNQQRVGKELKPIQPHGHTDPNRPKPSRTPVDRSAMPPTWNAHLAKPRPSAASGEGAVRDVGPVVPITDNLKAAMRERLDWYDAWDLADMLGVTA